jgi:hypothetical protein
MRRGLVLLLAAVYSSNAAAALCDSSIEQQFSRARIVALVQVEETDGRQLGKDSPPLLVIASWKGPYHAGTILHAVPPICGGYPCTTYPFRVGEIVLVFAGEYGELISPTRCSVIAEHDAEALMPQLYKLSWATGPNNRWRGP